MAEIIYENSIKDVLPARFLDYSIAVLKDRAIPDGFDGLKPIHRRVLMAMHDLGLSSKTPYRKCAKTIGEVLGKYHPHGDQSAYEALVGLAQEFNMRYPLVDGSGNFGSVNGDPAAAMRYTEARLSVFGELMLEDVGKLSPTKDNFDNSAQEPITLSSYFPNLLCNPQTGIAVGLATKFAPHYARDIYTALIKTIELEAKGKEISLEELIDIVQAPDFPTGAQIINANEVRNIYRTGKGPVTLRAKYRLEKNNLIYYEIPYKITPKSILEKIAGLGIDDIKDARDESSLQNGLRLVIELKKGANPDYIVNRLFKDTELQCNYNVNMVAILDNRPKAELTLKTIVNYYLQHLQSIHRKALLLRKQELEDKIFVINTLLKAILYIEEIIRIVRHEDNPVLEMQKQLGFTKEEAEYIFNIKISALSKASKQDLDEKKALYEAELAQLAALLGDKVKFLLDIAKKLKSIRDGKLFKGDERRTELLNVDNKETVDIKDYVKNEPVVIIYTNKGIIKAVKAGEFRTANRSLKLREDEYITEMLNLNTHDDLLLLSDKGKAFVLQVHKLPLAAKGAQGKTINNYLNLEDEEKIILIAGIPEYKADLSVLFATRNGFVKRTELEQFTKVKGTSGGSRAIGLEAGDAVAGAALCLAKSDLVIVTSQGRCLKFNIDDEDKPVRPSGKGARGVQALKLKPEEQVAAALIMGGEDSLLLLTANGYGKRLNGKSLKDQKRNQAPVQFFTRLSDLGPVTAAAAVKNNENLIVTTSQGIIEKINVSYFTSIGKNSKAQQLFDYSEKEDTIAAMTIIIAEEEPLEEDQQTLF